MITVVKSPTIHVPTVGQKTVFLGGTIDMGKSLDWQTLLITLLKKQVKKDTVIYNPHRDHWDATWKQEPGDNPFTEQVNWEMDYLASSDINVFYYAPNSKSPITLLEMGWSVSRPQQKKIVFCRDNYSRHGNVKIFCDRANIAVFENYEEFVNELARMINV